MKGVFSLYAASSGQAARDRLSDDDSNPNSVFSRVLAPMLTRPGIDLASLAIDVREEVARIAKTAGYEQQPAYYDETSGGRVYLNGAPPVGGPRAPFVDADVERAERTWGIIQNTTNVVALDEFIQQFGAVPVYGALARARREELAKSLLPQQQEVQQESDVVTGLLRMYHSEEWKKSCKEPGFDIRPDGTYDGTCPGHRRGARPSSTAR